MRKTSTIGIFLIAAKVKKTIPSFVQNPEVRLINLLLKILLLMYGLITIMQRGGSKLHRMQRTPKSFQNSRHRFIRLTRKFNDFICGLTSHKIVVYSNFY
jgi:hypothetical protein